MDQDVTDLAMEDLKRSWAEASEQPERRTELALHTLTALSELGFAKLNLREIAARSGVSLGVIHYHFEDKTELLCCAITIYKDAFAKRLETCIAGARDADTLTRSFAEVLCESIEQHGKTHRLWYDVRAQALFEAGFQQVVTDLEERLIEVVGLLLQKLERLGGGAPLQPLQPPQPPQPLPVYLEIDGWFRYALQQTLCGNPNAVTILREETIRLLSGA